MSDIVAEWYEDKKNVDEMQGWNSALKEWERSVTKYFPTGAKILDIGCGLGTNIRIAVWKRILEKLFVRIQTSP